MSLVKEIVRLQLKPIGAAVGGLELSLPNPVISGSKRKEREYQVLPTDVLCFEFMWRDPAYILAGACAKYTCSCLKS